MTNPWPTSEVANLSVATPSASRRRARSSSRRSPRSTSGSSWPPRSRCRGRRAATSAVRPAPPGKRIGSPSVPPIGSSGNGNASVSRRQRSTGATFSSTCPVINRSPVRIALRTRISTGSRPHASASRSSCDSWAKQAWTTPKPRIAPHGRWFVRDRPALDDRVRAAVRPLRVGDRVEQHGRRGRRVGAAVEHVPGLDLDDLAVGGGVVAHPDRGRVAVHVAQEALGPRVVHAHRPPEPERQQAGVDLERDVFSRRRMRRRLRRARAAPPPRAAPDRRRSACGPRAATGWRRAARPRARLGRGSPGPLPARGRPGPASRSGTCPRPSRRPTAVGSPYTIRWCRSTLPRRMDRLGGTGDHRLRVEHAARAPRTRRRSPPAPAGRSRDGRRRPPRPAHRRIARRHRREHRLVVRRSGHTSPCRARRRP